MCVFFRLVMTRHLCSVVPIVSTTLLIAPKQEMTRDNLNHVQVKYVCHMQELCM